LHQKYKILEEKMLARLCKLINTKDLVHKPKKTMQELKKPFYYQKIMA
jgi:hypothetical protein